MKNSHQKKRWCQEADKIISKHIAIYYENVIKLLAISKQNTRVRKRIVDISENTVRYTKDKRKDKVSKMKYIKKDISIEASQS